MLKKQLSMDFTLLFTGRIFLGCESRMSDFRFNYAPMQHSKPTYQLRFEFILFCLYFFTICIVLIIIISFLCPCRQSEFTITLIMFLMFSHFIPWFVRFLAHLINTPTFNTTDIIQFKINNTQVYTYYFIKIKSN